MTAVKGKHWPPGTPFVGYSPGDFIFSDEVINAEEQTRPKWLWFGCPRGKGHCCVPLAPQTTSKGHTWHWDGNRDAPTLTPSINCLSHNPNDPAEKYAGCGWHGFLRAGIFSAV